MRKIFMILMVLVLTVVIIGCGDDSNSKSSNIVFKGYCNAYDMNQNAEIAKSGNSYILKTTFSDGSGSSYTGNEKNDGIYFYTYDGGGSYYVYSNGSLKIYDNEGYLGSF